MNQQKQKANYANDEKKQTDKINRNFEVIRVIQ